MQLQGTGLSRLLPFLGFSRVLQATLSVAEPFFFAVVALHGFPSPGRLILALSAGFAGSLAVFALNDLLDRDLDTARFAHLRSFEGFDIDSAVVRHPLAQRQIGMGAGMAWIGLLAAYALAVAWLLSPAAAGLFVGAAALELLYCKLAKVTPLKILVIGAMIGTASMAGWAAMTGEVRPREMAVLFAWMFAWEIGGRNIVNDFADVEEDERLGIRTVPVVYGPRVAARLTVAFLLATFAASLMLYVVSHFSLSYLAGAAATGLFLLLLPAARLLRTPTPERAMALFTRACLYPPVMLLVLIASLYLPVA